jgi:hypothetical protein
MTSFLRRGPCFVLGKILFRGGPIGRYVQQMALETVVAFNGSWSHRKRAKEYVVVKK